MSEKCTFDAKPSARSIDENGFLHVASSHITKAIVNPYYGREIPGWKEAGLDPDHVYYGLRSPEELKKSVPTWQGLPLHIEHHLDSADAPARLTRVGAVGAASWNPPYIDAGLTIWDGTAIEAVADGSFKELSCAYRYDPDFTAGTYEGVDYDFVMRNIRGNHVALVEEGRAGHDVVVADAALAQDDSWISVHPNGVHGKGRPVKLDDNGNVLAGMGGKFNGRHIDDIPRGKNPHPVAEEKFQKRQDRLRAAGKLGLSMKTFRHELPKKNYGRGETFYGHVGYAYGEKAGLSAIKKLSNKKDFTPEQEEQIKNAYNAAFARAAANSDYTTWKEFDDELAAQYLSTQPVPPRLKKFEQNLKPEIDSIVASVNKGADPSTLYPEVAAAQQKKAKAAAAVANRKPGMRAADYKGSVRKEFERQTVSPADAVRWTRYLRGGKSIDEFDPKFKEAKVAYLDGVKKIISNNKDFSSIEEMNKELKDYQSGKKKTERADKVFRAIKGEIIRIAANLENGKDVKAPAQALKPDAAAIQAGQRAKASNIKPANQKFLSVPLPAKKEEGGTGYEISRQGLTESVPDTKITVHNGYAVAIEPPYGILTADIIEDALPAHIEEQNTSSIHKGGVMSRFKKWFRGALDADPDTEKKEVDLAQAIIDLHKVDPKTGEVVDVTEDEDKAEEIRRVLDKFTAGKKPEEIKELADALNGLAYSPATGDDDPDNGEEKAAADDEDEPADPSLKKAMDRCGLDADDPDTSKAFAEGVKYGESLEKDPAERARLDSEHESEGLKKAMDKCGIDAENPVATEAFAEGVKYGEEKEKAEPEKLDRLHESEGAKKAFDADEADIASMLNEVEGLTPDQKDQLTASIQELLAQKGQDADPDAPAAAQDRAFRVRKGRVATRRGTAFDAARIRAGAAADAWGHTRAVYQAVEDVRPLVGSLNPLAFDSASDVYGYALDQAGMNPEKFERNNWRAMIYTLKTSRANESMKAVRNAPAGKFTGHFAGLNNIILSD